MRETMNEVQIQYKRDTGSNAVRYAEEIISYDDFEDAEIYDPDYVKWLEDKVEQLSPKQ